MDASINKLLIIIWLPSHIQIAGNKKVDMVAKPAIISFEINIYISPDRTSSKWTKNFGIKQVQTWQATEMN